MSEAVLLELRPPISSKGFKPWSGKAQRYGVGLEAHWAKPRTRRSLRSSLPWLYRHPLPASNADDSLLCE